MEKTLPLEQEPFAIGELSVRTGVNSVTLRAWERRYGLLKPQRTEKGHRLYTAHDVKRVQQILAFIERGVPLRKIRPLLAGGELERVFQDDSDAQGVQQQLLQLLEQCQQGKLANKLQQMFKEYPANWCREQVLQPLFSHLAHHAQRAALEALLQAELIRYAASFMVVNKTHRQQPIVWVFGGLPTAPWRALLLALELQEKQPCSWLPGPFSLAALEQLLALNPAQPMVYCLDGVLSAEQEQQLARLLQQYESLWLQGTAAELSFRHHERTMSAKNVSTTQ